MDLVANAYATLGLSRGCTPAELKSAYRRLVKIWHPDRHQRDPRGQAEATVQLRVINQAFRVVAGDIGGARDRVPARPSPSAEGPRTVATSVGAAPAGRRLTQAELDAMVRALGTEGPVDALLAWVAQAWPFGLAVLLLITPGGARGPTKDEVGAALVLLGYGVARLVWKKLGWTRDGRGSIESR